MSDIIATIGVIGVGLVMLLLMQRRLDQRWESSWVGFAFVAHIGAAFAQIAVTRGYYGGGDMVLYRRAGGAVARLVRADPERFFPELLALIVHRHPDLPIPLLGAGGATGSMSGLTALASLVTNDSIYASAIIFSLLSFSGSWALYIVFRETFPASLRQRLVITCLGLPSVVFWTSGILKESVAMAGFGWVLLGTHRVSRGEHVGWPAVIVGALLMAAVKPYILIAYAASVGVYFYWRRAVRRDGGIRIRPVYLVLFSGAGVAALLAFGEIFPRYAISGLADETARLQSIGARISGGSNYTIADPGQRSVLGQLAYGPIALATTLFRPLPFEVSGLTMALSTIETTILTSWLVLVLWRRRWSDIWSLTLRSPLLMFSGTFIVLFGVAVGLASTNLGSLSRYRAPMVPLFASMIAIWGGWRPSVAGARRAPIGPPARARMRRRRPSPHSPEVT